MAVKVGGFEMPAEMAARGTSYLFSPPAAVVVNGLGEAVTAGGCSLTWGFAALSLDEWAWWTQMVLGDKPSKAFSGAGSTVLVNDLGEEQTFSECVVFRPVAEGFTGIYYRSVQVRLEQLYP